MTTKPYINEDGNIIPENLTFEVIERLSDHIPSSYDTSPASACNFKKFLDSYTGPYDLMFDNFFENAQAETVKEMENSAEEYFQLRIEELRKNGKLTPHLENQMERPQQPESSWVPDGLFCYIDRKEAWTNWKASVTRYHALVDKWIEENTHEEGARK